MAEIDAVARELVLLFRSLKGLHRAALAEAGVRLEMPATAVLVALEERDQQRASALAEALHLDLSSVSRQVAALEREGWVRRERDPADSRAALLDLTAAGRDVLRTVRAARLAHLAERLPDWTAEELQHFADQLRRFRTDLAATPEDPAATPAGPPAAPDGVASTPDRTPTPANGAYPDPDLSPALAGRKS